jgi:hypothetical protein
VISPYPAVSQQFLGFKKLSFVGAAQTIGTGQIRVVSMISQI